MARSRFNLNTPRISMEFVSKGCNKCLVGFKVPVSQEYVWNYCPSCKTGLELDVDSIELEYDTDQDYDQ